MYRVLLPEGELTVTTSIEFLWEATTRVSGSKGLHLECFAPDNDADHRALFIHCKMPYTRHDGVLIGNLTGAKVNEIRKQLLKDGYYDFSDESMGYTQGVVSADDAEDGEIYYAFLVEEDFQRLLK